MTISRRGFVRLGAAAAAGVAARAASPALAAATGTAEESARSEAGKVKTAGIQLKFIDDVEAGRFPKGKGRA